MIRNDTLANRSFINSYITVFLYLYEILKLKNYQNKAVPALKNWPQHHSFRSFKKINNFCYSRDIFMTAQITSSVWMTDVRSATEILLRSIS